jgi:eukaryotic-like serine/threonine-protein kinase
MLRYRVDPGLPAELMNEPSKSIGDTAFLAELKCQRRLDSLVRGECSEDDFLSDVLRLRETNRESAWNVVALLDQRFRRGQIPAALFRSIETKIARSELSTAESGMTIDLEPPNTVPDAELLKDGETGQAGPSTPPVLEVGQVLRDRYLLECPLGSGGMGTVFKALDRFRCDLDENNRHVAIKFLHPNINGNPDMLANLRREFYCAQALSHDNIVNVYDLDQDEDAVFFTMEFLEGELLSALMERSHPAPIPRSLAGSIILQLGAGLAHAHARNVVHGDLKPRNVMITDSGVVRILDFGASSATGHRRFSTALTPAFASCELLDGKPADPRDDLYALACIAYELLAAEHPFQGRRSTEARDHGVVAKRPPGLTQPQWDSLAMGLAWRREDRSISVQDWIAKLNPGAPAAAPVAAAPVVAATPAPLVAVRAPAAPAPVAPPAAARAPSPAAPEPPPAVVAPPPAARTPTPAPAAPAVRVAAPAPAPRVAAPVQEQIQSPAPAGPGDIKAKRSARPTPLPLPAIAALALVVLGLALWFTLGRHLFETRMSGGAAADSTASLAVTADSDLAQPAAADDDHLPADSTSNNQAAQAAQTAPAAQSAAGDAASPAVPREKPNSISISASTYPVEAGQKFVEVRVHRAPGPKGSTSFVWWTEPGKAVAGTDYIPQDRVTQLLPSGTHAASLFVRIVPQATRKRSAVFYVVIGEPGDGASLGRITRATVVLPPK